MSPVFHMFRSARSILPAAFFAIALAAGPSAPVAQGVTLQVPRAIGKTHAEAQPYNFTGRIFVLDDTFTGFGSGTLLRRHTVITAGHVVYDPTAGFISNATFARALYGTAFLSRDQVISATAIAGYQSAVTTTGTNTSNQAFAFDQGYLLLHNPPVDGSWGNYIAQPSLLSASTSQFFVLGYPGVTFDGRTMAVIVPLTSYVPVGTSVTTGSYENDDYLAEEGMSGGPVYVVLNGKTQLIAATTVGGIDDTSGEFSASFVRAIDKTANKAIINGEYTSGLIKRVKVTGPTTVQRGQTYSYTMTPIFSVPGVDGKTTNRYAELKPKSDNAGVPTNPALIIKKTSNTTFDVTYTSAARAGNLAVLQIFYDKATVAPGKSSLTVLIK